MNIKKIAKGMLLWLGESIYGNDRSKVVYYHDIHTSTPYTEMSTPLDLMKTHIEIAEECGYTFTPKASEGEFELEINFDDGFRGIYEHFDLFAEKKIPVRLFMVTDFIDRPGYLSAKELLKLGETGLFYVGSHGLTHKNFDTLSPNELKKELEESKKILEDLLGKEVDTLCFPRGRFNDNVLEYAKNAGYKRVYSSLPGPAISKKEGVVNRSLVQHADSRSYKAILRGADMIHRSRYEKMHYTKSVT